MASSKAKRSAARRDRRRARQSKWKRDGKKAGVIGHGTAAPSTVVANVRPRKQRKRSAQEHPDIEKRRRGEWTDPWIGVNGIRL